ncbi:hypothetical protein BJ322DRAFT_1031967 [Thelephora terrestris]|uniref:X-box-binding protein 1 n=1 Tax=Thelephora terrestris TaxID=56493 RepID=A0A9P6HW66_9AGAM|nr:hypothetical protein BJ322DRAFT_1031967 [Thelephora terrestris]
MSSTSAFSSPSPSESSSAAVRPTSTRDDSAIVEPPRKRARTDLTPEQRRDARAHRNRIAAQNSRDKRKAHFAHLEKRVAELEQENHLLRAGMSLSQFTSADNKSVSLERESVQARENRELRDRIKSLESGWTAVIKALQASGLPLNIQVPPCVSTDSPAPPSTSCAGSLPTIVPPLPAAYPISPATSTSSLPSSNIFEEFESTCHLARVATVESGAQLTPTSQQRVDSQRIIIPPNSTPLHHLQRRRLPPTTRHRNRSAIAPWRNYCGRSLPPHLHHQLRLSISKFSPQIPKLQKSRRHPSRRR